MKKSLYNIRKLKSVLSPILSEINNSGPISVIRTQDNLEYFIRRAIDELTTIINYDPSIESVDKRLNTAIQLIIMAKVKNEALKNKTT